MELTGEKEETVLTLPEELKIIDDVRQLKARYFRFLDTKDWEGFADVFCRDATADYRTGTAVDPEDGSQEAALSADFVVRGGREIMALVRDAVGESTTVHHGHCHEVWVDSPDAARGVIAMVDIITNSRTGELLLEGYGHYHETYRREGDAWRIASLRLSRLRVTSNMSAK
jgi:hypothetical protein